MTQNSKPEWFEIIDKDEKPELRKLSKSLPVSAVLVTALILGVGTVVTQTQIQVPASAAVAMAQKVQSSQTSAVTTHPTAVVVAAVSGNKLVNPAISKLPTGGGDEEEEDDNDD